MKVREVYEPGIIAAQIGETLKAAAARMRGHDIGALAVYDGAKLTGIITERDLARAVADGADSAAATVREYMTLGAVPVSPDTDVSAAAGMLVLLRARHLPVVAGGRVIGMLSVRDLLVTMASAPARVSAF